MLDHFTLDGEMLFHTAAGCLPVLLAKIRIVNQYVYRFSQRPVGLRAVQAAHSAGG